MDRARIDIVGLKVAGSLDLQNAMEDLHQAGMCMDDASHTMLKLSGGDQVTIELPADKVATLSQRFKIGTPSFDVIGTKTGVLRKIKNPTTKELDSHLKMYVMIGDVPPNFAVVAASHAPLVCYWRFEENEHMQAWKRGTIFTVICKVTDMEFPGLKLETDNVVITESRLGGKEVAIAFCPRPVWPTYFKFLPLWNV